MTEEEKKERLRRINGITQGTQSVYTKVEETVGKVNKATMSAGKICLKLITVVLSLIIIGITVLLLFNGANGMMIPSLLFVLAILNYEGIIKFIKKQMSKEKDIAKSNKADIIKEEIESVYQPDDALENPDEVFEEGNIDEEIN